MEQRMPGARLSRASAVRRLQSRSSANATYEASQADRLSRSSQTRSSSENTGYRVIPRRRKASKAVHPESAASCSAATRRRSPLATSESMRCGACSCSLARALLAGPALSSADRAAEASTTITCRHVQHLGRAVSWRHSHRNRAGCRATQGCPPCATPHQVPLPLPPLPTRSSRSMPSTRRLRTHMPRAVRSILTMCASADLRLSQPFVKYLDQSTSSNVGFDGMPRQRVEDTSGGCLVQAQHEGLSWVDRKCMNFVEHAVQDAGSQHCLLLRHGGTADGPMVTKRIFRHVES